MADMDRQEAQEFYEEDEDPRKIFEAFAQGEQGLTAAPHALTPASQVLRTENFFTFFTVAERALQPEDPARPEYVQT
ncbi:hypothetical protein ACIQVC_02725 [Streptomyces sp. NPDC101112]|uniref:hypothetical protein n=1 Tax=Streptomyces sp. NPDC101112 TaxID=3366105 RepID=UPI003823F410